MRFRFKQRFAAAVVVAAGLMSVVGAVPAVAIEGTTPDNVVRTGEIVVTATRVEEKVSEVAASVSVVIPEESTSPRGTMLGDALQGLPGVDVQRKGSAGNLENIKIRGGKSTHTLVLIDGFPVNSPGTGEFDIGSLPSSGLDRIEVVRGAQSALYGSNALAGVVQIIPKTGDDGRGGGLSLSGGSEGTGGVSGFLSVGEGRGWARLQFGRSVSDGIMSNDGVSLSSVLANGSLPIGSAGDLSFLFLVTDKEKEIPIDWGGKGDVNHTNESQGRLFGARWEKEFGKTIAVTLSAAVHRESMVDDDPAEPGNPDEYDSWFGVETKKQSASALVRFSPSQASTTFVGVEYVDDQATNDYGFGYVVTGGTSSHALFAQEEWRPTKRIGVSLGARFDRNEMAGSEFNPRAAAYFVASAEHGIRIRAAAGRGFRTPTVVEQFDPTLGNAALRPETANSYEAGVDAGKDGGLYRFSATAFRQDISGLIQIGPAEDGYPWGRMQNVSGATSTGIESGLTLRIHPKATVIGAFTWTRTHDEANDRRILGVPDVKGSLSLVAMPCDRLTARVDWRAESDQLDFPPDGFEPVERGGYAVVDASAKYRLVDRVPGKAGVDLSLKLRNILDREYQERIGYPAPGFGAFVGMETTI